MKPSRSVRVLLALPFLLSLRAQAPIDPLADCRAWQESDLWLPPIPLAAIAVDRPVVVAEGAVLAHEAARIGTRAWLLDADLRLPMPDPVIFPAGTPLEPRRTERSDSRLCLPLIPPDTAAGAPPHGTGLLPCLTDADGDSIFDRIDLFDTDYRMHVPMEREAGSLQPDGPIRLALDPAGNPFTWRPMHRRIVVTALDGDRVQLAVRHSFSRPEHVRAERQLVDGPQGAHVLVVVASRPFDPLEHETDWRRGDETVTARLADGAVIEAGGIRLRIRRTAAGWTATPLDARFPAWIRYGCGGRSIQVGAAP